MQIVFFFYCLLHIATSVQLTLVATLVSWIREVHSSGMGFWLESFRGVPLVQIRYIPVCTRMLQHRLFTIF